MANLGCSYNAAVAFDFFVGKGLRDFQAAAIVGNLQQESGLDPRVPEIEKGAHGIAQWHSPRWDALLAFAAQAGRDPWSLDLQLQFVWHELESNPSFGLTDIRSAQTLEEATAAFQNRFEICGDCQEPKRIAFAQAALYACPKLNPPSPLARKKPISALAAAAGVVALVAVAGYGAYEARLIQERPWIR